MAPAKPNKNAAPAKPRNKAAPAKPKGNVKKQAESEREMCERSVPKFNVTPAATSDNHSMISEAEKEMSLAGSRLMKAAASFERDITKEMKESNSTVTDEEEEPTLDELEGSIGVDPGRLGVPFNGGARNPSPSAQARGRRVARDQQPRKKGGRVTKKSTQPTMNGSSADMGGDGQGQPSGLKALSPRTIDTSMIDKEAERMVAESFRNSPLIMGDTTDKQGDEQMQSSFFGTSSLDMGNSANIEGDSQMRSSMLGASSSDMNSSSFIGTDEGDQFIFLASSSSLFESSPPELGISSGDKGNKLKKSVGFAQTPSSFGTSRADGGNFSSIITPQPAKIGRSSMGNEIERERSPIPDQTLPNPVNYSGFGERPKPPKDLPREYQNFEEEINDFDSYKEIEKFFG